MASSVWEKGTLKFWHGGKFRGDSKGGLMYVGGLCKTHDVEVDELCYWDVCNLAKALGPYDCVNGIFFQTPGMSMQGGIKKVDDDNDVRAMAEILNKYRTLDMFVQHEMNGPELLTSLDSQNKCTQPTKKLTPQRGPTSIRPTNISLNLGPPTTHPEPSTQNKSKKLSPKTVPAKTKPTAIMTLRSNVGPPNNQATAPNTVIPNTPLVDQVFKPNSQENTPLRSSPRFKKKTESEIQGPHVITPVPKPQKKSSIQIPLSTPTVIQDPTDITSNHQSDNEALDNISKSLEYSSFSDDSEDSLYKPKFVVESDDELDKNNDGIVDEEYHEFEDNNEDEAEDECGGDVSDTSDEEYHLARERVKACTSKLFEVSKQLQREAAEGKLPGQQAKLKEVVSERHEEKNDGYVSEYYDTDDDLNTPPLSEDEGEGKADGRRSKRSMLVGKDTDFSHFEWKVGQRFATREDFRQVVAKYGILQGRNLGYFISNKDRRQQLGVKCKEGCPFYLFSSWHSLKGSFIVKKVVNEHRCQRNMKKNKQLTTMWAAKEMLEVFKARPHWPAEQIKETIKRAYKAIVTRNFAYKTKYKAHKLLHGSMQEHYNKVHRYIAALKAISPHTVLDLVVDVSLHTNPPTFQRLFNCFDGLRKGWKEGCRRIICVDGAFLKTFLGGQLLSAVGRDPNDQMFPICWAVVEGENNFSWEWFFIHLQSCLELGDGTGLAIVSDEHQGILNAVATVLPKAEHRHCARHIYANWQKLGFRGDEMKLAFWSIAKAYNMSDFNEALQSLEESNPAAAVAFRGYTPENFCRAFMNPDIKCDAITNNMAETFNGYIINARTKHLLYMMEEIRGALMNRVCTKKIEMEKKTSMICPRIQGILDKEKDKACYCDVIPSTEHVFNVSHNLDTLVVNLTVSCCTCKKWDLMGVPCCHAIACIYFLNREAEEYVNECYKREVYLRCYANPVPVCEGERHWPRIEQHIDPPPIKIGPGRPRRNRIKDPFENPKKPGTLTRHGMEMTCKLCNKKGHNKSGCPDKDTAVPQEPPAKKARGRPRKYPAPQHDLGTTSNEHAQPAHHSVSAQPSQLGRGGRMILGGAGARGRGTGRGSVGTRRGIGRGTVGTGRGNGRGAVGTAGSGGGRASTGRGRGNGRGRGRGRNQVVDGSGIQREINVCTQSSQTSTIEHNNP